MRSLKTLSLLVLALAVPAAGASAQEPGVIIDEDSPSGKEYALPFDKARQDGSGSGGKDGASGGGLGGGSAGAPGGSGNGGSTPLFGEGISPAHGAEAAGARRTGGDRAGTYEGGTFSDSTSTDQIAAEELSSEEAVEAAAANGGSSSATPIGVALAVLLAGALMGAAIRWRSRRQPT